MYSEKKWTAQPEFWIAADHVVTTAQTGFYTKLEETLESIGFAAKVRALCQSNVHVVGPRRAVGLAPRRMSSVRAGLRWTGGR
jgi:hypothetical protein